MLDFIGRFFSSLLELLGWLLLYGFVGFLAYLTLFALAYALGRGWTVAHYDIASRRDPRLKEPKEEEEEKPE